MKKNDPVFLLIKFVFLPIQPNPLFFAQALSSIGAESTNILAFTSPIFSFKIETKFFNLSFITQW